MAVLPRGWAIIQSVRTQNGSMLDEISAIGVQPQRIVTSVINTSFTAPLHVRRKRRGLARRSHGAVNMGGGTLSLLALDI